jgi:cysteine-rich repeat protein
MTMTKTILTLLVASAALAVAPAARAGGLPVFKCGSAKQKAVGKDESALLGCRAKYVSKPDNPDPTMSPTLTACVMKADGGLDTAFGKTAVLPPCPGDPTTVHTEINNCVSNVIDTISDDMMGHVPAGQEKCASSKLKAAGKGAASLVNCLSKEAGKGGLCALATKTPCALDADCNTMPGDSCVAVPPAKICAGQVPPVKCTDDTACMSGHSCVDACINKAEGKFTAAIAKVDTVGGAPCQALGTPFGVLATVEGGCVKTITGGLPGKPADACGNGVVEASNNETCDDGNTRDGDGCPAGCQIKSCTPTTGTATFHVTYSGPGGVNVVGFQAFIDYPEDKVHGAGATAPFNVQAGANDLGYGLNVAPLDKHTPQIALPNPTLTLNFANLCQGAPAASASDFSCTVTDAVDDSGNSVTGVTCTVTP